MREVVLEGCFSEARPMNSRFVYLLSILVLILGAPLLALFYTDLFVEPYADSLSFMVKPFSNGWFLLSHFVSNAK